MSKFYRKLSPDESQKLTEKVLKQPYGPIYFKNRVIRLFGTKKDGGKKS